MAETPDVLEIKKDLLPYKCSILLAGELFELHVNYNAAADLFTLDLYKNGELICAGEPIIYGVPLWQDVFRSDSFPALTITPVDPSGESNAVTFDNLGSTVLLIVDNGEAEVETKITVSEPGNGTDTDNPGSKLRPPANVSFFRRHGTQYGIIWDAADGATEYRVYSSENGSEYAFVKTTSEQKTSVLVNDAINSEHTFRVSSTDGSARSMLSVPAIKAHVIDAPKNLAVSANGSAAVNLTWDAVEGATAYRLYRSDNGGGFVFMKAVTETSTGNYSLDLNANEYRYMVVAVGSDSEGELLSWDSNIVTIGTGGKAVLYE